LFGGDYLIRKVGGSATVTPARADRTNKGNATLKTTVKGKYERASPTIASDRAQKEDWAIEFIDPVDLKSKVLLLARTVSVLNLRNIHFKYGIGFYLIKLEGILRG
jgi:hypothetical protein